MARPLRVEFSGAVYYITSHGNGGQNIFTDSKDGQNWIEIFGNVCNRFKWICYAYCLMSDHYHIVIETPIPNLSNGMRQLNGVYTQDFNRRHNRGGHIFQGRFKSTLVQKEKYLSNLIRFVLYRPVDAGYVELPKQFKWSSCKYLFHKEESPIWMSCEGLLEPLEDLLRYEIDITQSIRRQIYLGDDQFILNIQQKIDTKQGLSEIPKVQRVSIEQLNQYQLTSKNRDEAIYNAYSSGNFSMKQIADYFSLHYSTVSRIIKEYENQIYI